MKSRVHRLVTFDNPQCKCYIKRDDELPYGSKSRKYQSLLPNILNRGIEEVVLIGGINSNHILAFSRLLTENNVKPTLFLKGNPQTKPVGNGLILQQEFHSIRWVSQKEWPDVEELPIHYASSKEKTLILPEGGSIPEALSGALSLADDLIDNESDLGFSFDHLFIDAGTGFTAIALLLGLAKRGHMGRVHVLLLADEAEQFEEKLRTFYQWMPLPFLFPKNYQLYRPTNARSFGSTNATVLREVKQVQEEEDILIDPIYSAKLCYEMRKILASGEIRGNAVMIHTGVSIYFSYQEI